MRTTLNLEDGLVRAAKERAAARGTTLTRMIEDSLRVALEARPLRRDFRLGLPIVRGRRAPEATIGDRSRLWEALDGERG